MKISKEQLRKIIAEELEGVRNVDEGSREDMMMPSLSQADLKIAELEERLDALEQAVATLAGG
jgi:hypothetical protein